MTPGGVNSRAGQGRAGWAQPCLMFSNKTHKDKNPHVEQNLFSSLP